MQRHVCIFLKLLIFAIGSELSGRLGSPLLKIGHITRFVLTCEEVSFQTKKHESCLQQVHRYNQHIIE